MTKLGSINEFKTVFNSWKSKIISLDISLMCYSDDKLLFEIDLLNEPANRETLCRLKKSNRFH